MLQPYLPGPPVQALIFFFLFAPALYVAWLSLNVSTFGQENFFTGLSNYRDLLADPYFWRAFRNTFIIVNIIVYTELVLGLGVALLFASGVPFSRLLIALVFLPYATSEVVAIVMVKYMFDPQIGMVNLSLMNLGLPTVDIVNPIHAFGLVVLISTWQHLPFTFILLYTARLGIPNDLYEAARLDGGSPFKIFRHITFRLFMPALLIAFLFRYIFPFRN